jgi:hypothetical protein
VTWRGLLPQWSGSVQKILGLDTGSAQLGYRLPGDTWIISKLRRTKWMKVP